LNRYSLAGLNVLSDILLPELAVSGDDVQTPDIVIRCPAIGQNIAGLEELSPIIRARKDGLTLLELPGIASCLIFGGRFIGIAPDDKATDQDIRCLILGPAFSLICHQRNLLPLRATSLVGDDGAIMLIGPSGVGKSALAAGLVERGYALFSDDVSVVDTAGGLLRLLPTANQAKLWEDTIEALGLPVDGLFETRKGLRRYFYRWPDRGNSSRTPTAIKRMLFLERSNVDRPSVIELSPKSAAAHVYESICNVQIAHYFGLAPRLQQHAALVAREARATAMLRRVTGDLSVQVSLFEEALQA